MNILIKLMSIVSLVIAPHIALKDNAAPVEPTAVKEAKAPVVSQNTSSTIQWENAKK